MSDATSIRRVRELSAVSVPEGFRTSGSAPGGTRVLLVRHGEAHCNVGGFVGGHRGCTGLTERGHAQAAALGMYFARRMDLPTPDALYVSELARARETASHLPLELWGCEPQPSHEWCEIEPGEADGLSWDEVVSRFGEVDWESDPRQAFSPGGESRLDFFERIAGALNELARRHPGQFVVVVAHGGVIEQALKRAVGADPSSRLLLRTEHCSFSEFDVSVEGVGLLSYNERARELTAD